METSSLIIAISAILMLFLILGKSASRLIANVRIISEKSGLDIYALGLILGVLTTLPEFAISLGSIKNGIDGTVISSMYGGILVLFCLILGTSIILNREIETDGKIGNLLPCMLLLILPMLLSFKGNLDKYDGLVILAIYCLVFYYVLRKQRKEFSPVAEEGLIELSLKEKLKKLFNHIRHDISHELFIILVCIVLILASSNLITRLAQQMLINYGVSEFMTGLLIFALGSNLPETIVMVKSWYYRMGRLSISHLIGSAMANIAVLGIIPMIKTISIDLNAPFMLLSIFCLLIFAILLLFYRTGKIFSRKEGFILVNLYLIFIALQSYIIIFR